MSAAILLSALSTNQLVDPLDEPKFYCLESRAVPMLTR